MRLELAALVELDPNRLSNWGLTNIHEGINFPEMDENLAEFVSREMLALPRKEWPLIAKAANVPESTAYKYAHRYTKRPSYEPLASLARVLRERREANA